MNDNDFNRLSKRRAPDRLPPHSIEAEQGVLACVLIDPAESLDTLAKANAILTAGPESFYDLRHRTIFSAMNALGDAGTSIDLITLQQKLKDELELEGVGGLVYLASLPEKAPSAANISYYLDIVRDKWALRLCVREMNDCVSDVFAGEESDATDIVETVASRITSLSRSIQSGEVTLRTLVEDAIEVIGSEMDPKAPIQGLTTGLPDLDRLTRGLAPEYIIIAGRPSQGKTSLAMQLADHAAIDLKLPVAVFSLEMTGKALVARIIKSRAKVNTRALAMDPENQQEIFGESERSKAYPKLTKEAGSLSGSKMKIVECPGSSVAQIKGKMRQLWQQFGIKLAVIDYLQLATPGRRMENRQQEISHISATIKSAVLELGIPILAVSQLNRAPEQEKNRRPRLSDLRESGSLEQDADQVWFIHDKDAEERTKSGDGNDFYPVKIIVGKSRNGPTGDVDAVFMRGYTRFESAARVTP